MYEVVRPAELKQHQPTCLLLRRPEKEKENSSHRKPLEVPPDGN
jgi:hypothetical protein